MVAADPRWTAVIEDEDYPVVSFAVVEHTVSESHTYAKTEVVAMVVCENKIVPASLQKGFSKLYMSKR